MSMNRTLFIIRDCYNPNTAAINRFMGFTKGFSESNFNTNVIFIRPSHCYDKVNFDLKNVTVKYLWENKILKKGKYKYIQQIYWVLSFLKNLKKGDDVILFGTSEFLFIFKMFRKKINLYHEITEHPEVARYKKSIALNFFHKIYLNSCKSAKGLFVISTSLKQYFSSIGVPEDRIHIINMTVDSSRFEALNKNTDCEKYIAYCGSIINSKDGVDTLIEAFKIVSDKIDDLKLYLIGEFIFKKDKEKDINLIEEFNLQNRIICTGEVSSTEMPQLLKNAQALVLARPNNLQAQNGFPTKLGEYLLTANPVVVTEVGDIPLFLKDGESAFIAEPGNVSNIADKIFCAISNNNESRKIGKKGREIALRHFNYKIEANQILNVIFENKL